MTRTRLFWVLIIIGVAVCGCTVQPERNASPARPSPVIVNRVALTPQQQNAILSERIRQVLDQILMVDSKSWLVNRYDQNSVSGAQIVQKFDKNKALVIGGSYTINNGKKMLILAAYQNANIRCIVTSDFPQSCRPIGQPPSHEVTLQAVLNALQNQQNTRYRSSSDSSFFSQEVDDPFAEMDRAKKEERQREVENRDALEEGNDMPHPDSDVAPPP